MTVALKVLKDWAWAASFLPNFLAGGIEILYSHDSQLEVNWGVSYERETPLIVPCLTSVRMNSIEMCNAAEPAVSRFCFLKCVF
jgi:hypothetical protein